MNGSYRFYLQYILYISIFKPLFGLLTKWQSIKNVLWDEACLNIYMCTVYPNIQICLRFLYSTVFNISVINGYSPPKRDICYFCGSHLRGGVASVTADCHSHTVGILGTTISLICICLGSGRNPEYLVEDNHAWGKHADSLRTLELQCNSAKKLCHLATCFARKGSILAQYWVSLV